LKKILALTSGSTHISYAHHTPDNDFVKSPKRLLIHSL